MVHMKLCKTGKLWVLAAVLSCGGKDKKVVASGGAGDTGTAESLPSDGSNPEDGPSDDPPADTGDTSGSDTGTAPVDVTDRVGDTMAEAAELRSSGGWDWTTPLAEDAIDHAGDIDMYRVDMIAGVQVMLAVEHVDAVDLHLRVLDTEDRVMGAAEVMPYRAWSDDPGLWVQARVDGVVYIEVTGTALEGSSGAYRLLGVRVDEEDSEPNDTDLDASDRFAEGVQNFRTSFVKPESHREFAGIMHAGGDVDLWVFEPAENAVLSWSMWEMASLVFEAKMTLYDSLMQPVAWSSAPTYQDLGSWYKDVGILYAVSAGERYYLGVENSRPPSGAGTLYVGVQTTEELATQEIEPNDTADMPQWVSLSPSTTHDGYSNTTLVGTLNGEDNHDVFALATEESGGQYVSVHLQTGLVGSGLSARLQVSSDVAGTIVVGGGTVDSTGELSLTDLLVPVDAEGLFVTVEAFGRTDPAFGNQFFLGLEQYPVPLHD
jgi:hypothetical protein